MKPGPPAARTNWTSDIDERIGTQSSRRHGSRTAPDAAAAVRTLAARARVIAEGAGALALAAALAGHAGTGKVVGIVSGGNIDLANYCEILGSTRRLVEG